MIGATMIEAGQQNIYKCNHTLINYSITITHNAIAFANRSYNYSLCFHI